MLKFLTYFVLVINCNRINGFYLFWDTLYDSVFEQLSRTNCVRKPRFDCTFYLALIPQKHFQKNQF